MDEVALRTYVHVVLEKRGILQAYFWHSHFSGVIRCTSVVLN